MGKISPNLNIFMSTTDPKSNPEQATTNPIESLASAKEQAKSRISKAYHAALDKVFGTVKIGELNLKELPKKSWIFVQNFVAELFGVEKAKEDVKTDTENQLAKEVMDTDPAKLADQYTKKLGEDAKFDTGESDAVKDMTGDVLVAMKESGATADVVSAIGRTKTAAESKKDPEKPLTENEMRAVFSTGLNVLANWKEKYKTEKAMTAALEKVKKAGGKSGKITEVVEYVGTHFKKLFAFDAMKVPEMLGLGIMDFAPLVFAGDKKVEGGVEILLEKLFPISVRENGMEPVKKLFVDVIKQKRYPDVAQISKMAFMLNTQELKDFAKRIRSANPTQLVADAKTPDNSPEKKEA